MSPFNFQPVQLLELSQADSPSIDVQDGKIILTAQRNGEQIRITAPLQNVLPQVQATTVQAPKRKAVTPSYGLLVTGPDKRRGEKNKMAKLTDEAVREIRLMLSDKKLVASYPSTHSLYLEIGKAYNIHFTTVRNIAQGNSWKHIKV